MKKDIENLRTEYIERLKYIEREITCLETAPERIMASAMRVMIREFISKLDEILSKQFTNEVVNHD